MYLSLPTSAPADVLSETWAGPVIGSLLGEWLVLLSWRWPMRLMTILIGINTCCVILFMRETYGPVLERKWLARRLAAETNEKRKAEAIAASAAPPPSFREIAIRTFTVRPALTLPPAPSWTLY